MPFRLLVTGSRDWTDRARARKELKQVVDEHGLPATLIHGDARGLDRIAAHEARQLGMDIETYPADWARWGRRAGAIRNEQMVASRADLCLAFPLPSSRGTFDCIRRAERAGIPVRVVTPHTEE